MCLQNLLCVIHVYFNYYIYIYLVHDIIQEVLHNNNNCQAFKTNNSDLFLKSKLFTLCAIFYNPVL